MQNVYSFRRISLAFFNLLIVASLFSCGPGGDNVEIEGHLLNMNQGMFMAYSPDGATYGIDTINVVGGRFTYETRCIREGSVMILMPNGTEIPVFVKPGKSISLDGNAQDLQNIKVKGTDENDLMNDFRKDIASLAKNEKYDEVIRRTVTEHPESSVGVYLVRRYLCDPKRPNYKLATTLLKTMADAQQGNPSVKAMLGFISDLQKTGEGMSLPKDIKFTDTNGKRYTTADLRTGITVITCVASWDYESINQLRRIGDVSARRDNPMRIIAISVDPTVYKTNMSLSHDDMNKYIVVCDGEMLDSPLLHRLAISQTMTAIIVRNGIIVERNLTGNPLYEKLRGLAN